MTGKDFVVLPAYTLPRLNAANMPPGKSKNAKSVAKKSAPPASKRTAASKAAKRSSVPAGRNKPRVPANSPPRRPVATKPTAGEAHSPQPAGNTLREQKNVIRKQMRESLLKMRGRGDRSAKICESIVSHPAWRRATIVALFAPMESEPDVELLWKHAEGRTICYPTIRMGGLDFIGVGGAESVSVGQFGIREPVFDQARVIPPDTFDLILVPGAAFTANGDRLGRGGGFYDRVLSAPGFRAFKVGVCFNRQICETLPLEPHDQRVHRVVTESGFLQRPDFIKAGKPVA